MIASINGTREAFITEAFWANIRSFLIEISWDGRKYANEIDLSGKPGKLRC